MRRPIRSAYSLLELLVASAIFAGMILAATATLSATATIRDQEQSSHEAANYAETLLRQISLTVAHASAVTMGTDWLAATDNPKTDDYGRGDPSQLSETYLYCSTGKVFQVFTSAASTPPTNGGKCGTPQNTNPYTVAIAATPLIQNSAVNAVRIQVTVQGAVGASAGGRTVPNVSYTAVDTVEYGNTSLPYETAN